MLIAGETSIPVASRVNTRITLKRHLIDEGQLRILAFLSKRNGAKIEDILNGLIADFNKTHLHAYLGEILAQQENDCEIDPFSDGGGTPKSPYSDESVSDANNGTYAQDANTSLFLNMGGNSEIPNETHGFRHISNSSSKINLKSLAKEIGEMSREDFIKAYSGRVKDDKESNKFKDIRTIEESVELCKYREKYSIYNNRH